jgi:hypothetical protein
MVKNETLLPQSDTMGVIAIFSLPGLSPNLLVIYCAAVTILVVTANTLAMCTTRAIYIIAPSSASTLFFCKTTAEE